MVFGQGLAQAERENHFHVGEMTENLAGVPLAGNARALDAVRAEAVQLERPGVGAWRR